MITLLSAVTMLNDATMLVQTLTPLINQAKALGLGDNDEISADALKAHADQTGANIDELRALIEKVK